MKSIFILGVGHNTPVLMEMAELNGYVVEGLFHYKEGREGEKVHDIPIIGSYDDLFKNQTLTNKAFALSMGDNSIRVQIASKIRAKNGHIPTLIHPTAAISKYAQICEGVIVQANATVQPDVIIKEDTVISFNAGIVHNATIEKGCYVANNSVIGAYTHILENVFVGMGAVIVSGKVPIVGKNAIIGAGAVVINSVEDFQTVIGNPAKPLKSNL